MEEKQTWQEAKEAEHSIWTFKTQKRRNARKALPWSRKQLSMSRDKWSVSQEKRAKNIFEQYQKREEAYNPINSLRALFRNKKLTKETTKEKYGEGYEKVSACSMREIKSVSNTIKFNADEIQNLFIERQTNASAKS